VGYISKRGRRPDEYASKSAHTQVINDQAVQLFLKECWLPKPAEEVLLSQHLQIAFDPPEGDPISHVIAVDGGYQEVPVRVEFPSASITFFQFGALCFSTKDLEDIAAQRFIDPEDIAKLKQIDRLKLALPTRNVCLKGEKSLTDSVRLTLFRFFKGEMESETLMDTLCWLIFREYGPPRPTWQLASCPVCRASRVALRRSEMSESHTFTCGQCGEKIYLTDVFRLHEAIDDELGAGGILGYVMTALEQLVIAHLIRIILKTKPDLLKHILFVKDGPLAFFGQTANLHQHMRALVRYLFKHHELYLVGLEKSGAFVEHADEIAPKLAKGTALILDNEYIYKYIIPGQPDPSAPYGRTTYYGHKVIFKTSSGDMHVLTLPTRRVTGNPAVEDLRNLQVVLANIEKLKCDMYDSALIPIALANRLVSLANHPSSRILQRFALDSVVQ